MAIIGRLVVRYRFAVIVFWLLLTAVCVRAFPSLSSLVNSDNSSFLPASSPVLHAIGLANPFQPANLVSAQIVAVRDGAPLTAADDAALTRLAGDVGRLEHVTLVRDQGASRDGHAHKTLVAVNVTASSKEGGQVVDAVRRAFTSSYIPGGLTLHFTGQLASGYDNQHASNRAQRATNLLSFLVIIVLLLLVFRALLAPLITLFPAALVLILAGPVIAKASQLGLQVSSVTQIILTVLVLGAGTDYGLFLTMRMREELRRGLSPADAVVRAVERVGESILFSAGTVVVALLSLLFATFGIYHSLGPGLAIGVALMLLAALTLLPALLAVAGPAAFWPSTVTAGTERTGLWGRLAGQVVRRPVLTLALGAALFGALALLATGYAPAGFNGSITGPAGSDSARGTDALNAHFPAAVARPTDVLLRFRTPVWNSLTVVQRAEDALGRQSVFSSVNGLLNPNGQAIAPDTLAQAYARLGSPNKLPSSPPPSVALFVSPATYNGYRALAQFVSPNGRTVEFYTKLAAGDPGSTTALQAMPAVRQAVGDVARSVGAVDSGVTGQAAVGYDVSHASDTDLGHIVPVVLLLIALLLAIVMRSLVAPLYLVATVALSYFASLGFAVLVFMHIGGSAGLNFVLPFLMFIFLMALGEDYNILVMSRIREEAHGDPLPVAVTRALGVTGTTVTSAGLILAATFVVAGVFGASDQIRQLGLGIGVGILLDTFLVRTLLVPSIVVLLGRWNWWPSRLSRRQPAAASSTTVRRAS